MLLFQKRFLAGLVDGSITLTFRQWPKLRVKPGGRYRTHPIGVLEVDAVDSVRVEQITAADARRAGFADRAELIEYLRPAAHGKFGPKTELYRIQLHYAGDGDWVPISREDKLSAEDVEQIDRRLAKFDAKQPWTRETLAMIVRRPKIAASKLAAEFGRPTAEFKADVVKLKKLGLTQSYEVGYSLSPRGEAYWKIAGRRR
jgi:hypothetical protein